MLPLALRLSRAPPAHAMEANADEKVIEQKGASDGEDNEQVRERIIAQLEQANAQIKVLEAQLGRLAGGASFIR